MGRRNLAVFPGRCPSPIGTGFASGERTANNRQPTFHRSDVKAVPPKSLRRPTQSAVCKTGIRLKTSGPQTWPTLPSAHRRAPNKLLDVRFLGGRKNGKKKGKILFNQRMVSKPRGQPWRLTFLCKRRRFLQNQFTAPGGLKPARRITTLGRSQRQ